MSKRTYGYKHTPSFFFAASPKQPASIQAATDAMAQVTAFAKKLGATVISDRQDWTSIASDATTDADPPVPNIGPMLSGGSASGAEPPPAE